MPGTQRSFLCIYIYVDFAVVVPLLLVYRCCTDRVRLIFSGSVGRARSAHCVQDATSTQARTRAHLTTVCSRHENKAGIAY